MPDEDPPVLRIGDCFRIALKIQREPVITDAGILSPPLRVEDIRRDASGTLEVIIGPSRVDDP